ncbi:MAG TPA: LLM class F420-dependent oxidoreductase [Acidimicrobiales bacterium]|nr:LLM class F420-dependent oxidoreductase [Acidimicrobiales bacterium]
MALDLGPVGIWSRELRFHPDRGAIAAAAGELEELGYSALFVPDIGGDVAGAVEHLLAATQRVKVVTGILNIWLHPAYEVAGWRANVELQWPGRFGLGLGASHKPVVEAILPAAYNRPLSKMEEYLDQLDSAVPPVPRAGRLLAALGPRMLELARDRSAGAHPYLVSPDHTRLAREILGPEAVLAPEQAVVLEDDRAVALERARAFVRDYLALPNYVNNLRRSGFSDADLAHGGSDRLVDTVVVAGNEAMVAERVAAHRAAGADHVCVYVVGGAGDDLPLEAWRRLAPALLG